jgi:hypothetical protein
VGTTLADPLVHRDPATTIHGAAHTATAFTELPIEPDTALERLTGSGRGTPRHADSDLQRGPGLRRDVSSASRRNLAEMPSSVAIAIISASNDGPLSERGVIPPARCQSPAGPATIRVAYG